MTTIRVPASTSNLGAGFDFLGLALALHLEARLAPGTGPPRYSGTLEGLDPRRDIAAPILAPILPPDRHVEIHSEIPVGKGLGSSAAAVVAALALRAIAEGGAPDRDAVFREGARIEGHPDNVAASVYGGLVLVANRPRQLPLSPDVAIAFAVPDSDVDTREARALLPASVDRATAVDQARRAAALVRGLTAGDAELLAFGLDDRIAAPHRARLIPGYDRATEAALEAGAIGVTISGAGSAVLAVTPQGRARAVADAMAEAFHHAGNPARGMAPEVGGRGVEVVEGGRGRARAV